MESKINELIEIELKQADKKFCDFHSTHEGYAVLKEEIEEAKSDIRSLKGVLDILWRDIRLNRCELEISRDIETIRGYAVDAIKELIQVAAMCDKFNRLKVKEKWKINQYDHLIELSDIDYSQLYALFAVQLE